MPKKRQRIEIPEEIAAIVLFASNRTCCVCRNPGKPVQLHHIDEDASHSEAENLAVLCFDCHRDTQLRGGFDRKLDAAQIKVFRRDWLARVTTKRDAEQGPVRMTTPPSGIALRYLQMKDGDEEAGFQFFADYVLVQTSNPVADAETNAVITAFLTVQLQRLRARSCKPNGINEFGSRLSELSLSHTVILFTPTVLSIAFKVYQMNQGAMCHYEGTQVLNFSLAPPFLLDIENILRLETDAVKFLSSFCIEDISRQHAQRNFQPLIRAGWDSDARKERIERGAAPQVELYKCLSITSTGLNFYFDPYLVGPLAEGTYEVFVHKHYLRDFLTERFVNLMGWKWD